MGNAKKESDLEKAKKRYEKSFGKVKPVHGSKTPDKTGKVLDKMIRDAANKKKEKAKRASR